MSFPLAVPFFCLMLALLIWRFAHPLDAYTRQTLLPRLLFFRSSKKRRIDALNAEFQWLSLLTGSLRCGADLQTSLQAFSRDNSENTFANVSQTLLRSVSQQSGDSAHHTATRLLLKQSVSAQIILHSLQYGTPCLELLQERKAMLKNEIQLVRKVQSATAQFRAQAYVSAMIPILFLIGFYTIEPSFITAIFEDVLSASLLGGACSLAAGGIFVIHRMVKNVTSSKGHLLHDLILPRILQVLIASISCGESATTAYRDARDQLDDSEKKLLAQSSLPDLKNLLQLIERAETHGMPIRNELKELLADLNDRQLNRWQTASSLLSVRLLIPLFTMIFPATLLIIALPILPLLLNF